MKSALREVLKPALAISIIFILFYAAYTHHEEQKQLEYLRTLHNLGYPEQGYIVYATTSIETRASNFTVTHAETIIRYADGEIAVIDEQGGARVFTVNISQARNAAKSFISPFENYGFSVDLDHFTETYKDAEYYYIFPVYFKGSTMGFLFVNRESGKVFFKNQLEEMLEKLKRGGSK